MKELGARISHGDDSILLIYGDGDGSDQVGTLHYFAAQGWMSGHAGVMIPCYHLD
jgi:hypothetical protein